MSWLAKPKPQKQCRQRQAASASGASGRASGGTRNPVRDPSEDKTDRQTGSQAVRRIAQNHLCPSYTHSATHGAGDGRLSPGSARLAGCTGRIGARLVARFLLARFLLAYHLPPLPLLPPPPQRSCHRNRTLISRKQQANFWQISLYRSIERSIDLSVRALSFPIAIMFSSYLCLFFAERASNPSVFPPPDRASFAMFDTLFFTGISSAGNSCKNESKLPPRPESISPRIPAVIVHKPSHFYPSSRQSRSTHFSSVSSLLFFSPLQFALQCQSSPDSGRALE